MWGYSKIGAPIFGRPYNVWVYIRAVAATRRFGEPICLAQKLNEYLSLSITVPTWDPKPQAIRGVVGNNRLKSL